MGLNDSNQDCLDITIQKYEKHPNIQMIYYDLFSLEPVSKDEVKKITKDIKNSKFVGGEIPTKIFEECDFTFEILTQCINNSFTSGEFPDCLNKLTFRLYLRKMTL